jgi:hypothetical protein
VVADRGRCFEFQASASPVLETMIDKARRGWGAAADCTVAVLGVHSDAVLAFLHLLYSSR